MLKLGSDDHGQSWQVKTDGAYSNICAICAIVVAIPTATFVRDASCLYYIGPDAQPLVTNCNINANLFLNFR